MLGRCYHAPPERRRRSQDSRRTGGLATQATDKSSPPPVHRAERARAFRFALRHGTNVQALEHMLLAESRRTYLFGSCVSPFGATCTCFVEKLCTRTRARVVLVCYVYLTYSYCIHNFNLTPEFIQRVFPPLLQYPACDESIAPAPRSQHFDSSRAALGARRDPAPGRRRCRTGHGSARADGRTGATAHGQHEQ